MGSAQRPSTIPPCPGGGGLLPAMVAAQEADRKRLGAVVALLPPVDREPRRDPPRFSTPVAAKESRVQPPPGALTANPPQLDSLSCTR